MKDYYRSGENKNYVDPIMTRPPRVLRMTLDYLRENILDIDLKYPKCVPYYKGKAQKYHQSYMQLYKFIFSRTRQIRLELRSTSYKTLKDSILIFEEIVRFHMLYINEGRDHQDFQYENVDNFTKLTSTLKTLMEFY